MKLSHKQLLVLEEVHLGLVYQRGPADGLYSFATFRRQNVTRQTDRLQELDLVTTVPLPPKYQTLGSRRFVTTGNGDEELIKRGIVHVD